MIKSCLPWVSNIVFVLISVGLAITAASLVVLHFWQVLDAFMVGTGIENSLIEAVEFLIIGLAIFDVSRFVLEEEVLEASEDRTPRRAREKLTRLLVVIVVAVALEALIKILRGGAKDLSLVRTGGILLFVDALMLVGLGIYQRLSIAAEQELPQAKS